MSTKRGLIVPPLSSAEALAHARSSPGAGFRRYRCLYCHEIFLERSELPVHELRCPEKAVVLRQWGRNLEKFKRRAVGFA